jgi:hypothetical protein
MSRRKLSEANNLNYDARTGLGYGTDGRRDLPRMSQGSWPYIEIVRDDVDAEDSLDSEQDLQTQVAIGNKAGQGHIRWDSYADRAADNRRFVSADFRMHEQTTGRGMSPIPDLYKNKQGVLGVGADGPAIRPAPARISLAGSKAGYSSAFPLRDAGSMEPAYTLEEIPSPDELTMSRLRRLIRAIHLHQDIEKD